MRKAHAKEQEFLITKLDRLKEESKGENNKK